MNRRIKIALSGGVAATLAAGAWIAGGGLGYASVHPSGHPTGHPTGHSPKTCSVPSKTYATIAAAVADATCSTIKVAPGTYAESLTIGRSLTLQGARDGQDARGRHGGRESVIGTGTAAAVTITADNVMVDGFTVKGLPGGGSAAFVMQQGNSGETIQNNIIDNPGRAASITTSRTTFRRNDVRNTSTANDGFQTNSQAVQHLTIDDNAFGGAPATGYNADITVIEGSADVVVSDNRSTRDGTLIALFKTNGARITGNTVVGTSNSTAIYIGGTDSNVSVSNNTVSSAVSGVKVTGSGNSRVTITRNTLHRNQYGVNVVAGSTTDAVQATRNSLTGNTLFGVFGASGQTNAACNWWGSGSGPGAVAHGRGDKVSAMVTYKPWLWSSNLNSSCR